MKIKIKDINGNWVWYDTETKLTISAEVLQGTIRDNAVKSVGADTSTKKGRVMAAHNQTERYNRRLHKVHNYADQTRKLELRQQTVSVDKLGEPIIKQTDYTPNAEAPTIPYSPLELYYIEAQTLALPFKLGSKALLYGLGKYGSKFGWNEALLLARNKILSDVFDRQSLKLRETIKQPMLKPILYNVTDNITLRRANPTKITNPNYKGLDYGDNTGRYVGKWFTNEKTKPAWYAANMAKRGEQPALYQIEVPRYWAEQQRASRVISNPMIESEPEDFIIEDGIKGLTGLLYKGRPGTLLYLTLKFAPITTSPNEEGALTFFLRKPSKISIVERMGIPKGERNNTSKYVLNTQAKVHDILSNQSLLTHDILEGAMQGYKDALKYYNSDQYLNHLINTGLSREKALELQKFKIGNLLDTKINFNNTDPNAYGHNVIEVATGSSRTELNPVMANTKSLARETTWHESGGHASSKNYKIEHQPVIDRDTYLRNIYTNSFYRKISEHNKELIPELKPQWKAYLDGDMGTFNKLATKEDYQIINKYKNPKEFINYINDEQEAAARAISANIGDFVGQSSQWNLPQLEIFFTKEGIKKLRDNVWSVGTSLGGGVVFEQIDYNPKK